jgi:hypothetical protein
LFASASETKKRRRVAEAAEKKEQRLEKAKRAEALEAISNPATLSGVSEPRVHRQDEPTGLPVYKYYDLGMATPGSGFTPDCPFDCDCCH